MDKHRFKRPGKLYLAGEYAVVSGGHALLMPTHTTMDLMIEKAVAFEFDGHFFSVDAQGNTNLTTPYVKEAIELAHAYILKKHHSLRPYRITTMNHLRLKSLPKLGFGTSAVITVLLIESILAYHAINVDTLTLYKLGVLAQIEKYPESSFGDIALVSQATWTHYVPFERSFRNTLLNQGLECLNEPWPGLILESMTPLSYPILILYTLEPASSLSLVHQVMKHEHKEAFKVFKETSDRLVKSLLQATHIDAFMKTIEALNQNLKTLETLTHTQLFTSEIKEIESIVTSLSGVSKFSGAGGGDSMIAVFKDHQTLKKAETILKDKYPILTQFFKEVPYE